MKALAAVLLGLGLAFPLRADNWVDNGNFADGINHWRGNFIADFGTARGTYWEIKPKLGSSAPQTFRAQVQGLTPLEDKTITIACPPGSGKLVILNVSLTDN